MTTPPCVSEEIQLPYGRSGLVFQARRTPGFLGVYRGCETPALENPEARLKECLLSPIGSPSLEQVAREKRRSPRPANTPFRACIVVSDITRPVPNTTILPPLLDALAAADIPREEIMILIATGIHRPNEGAELDELLGPDIARRYRVENHFSKRSEDMADLGHTMSGIPIQINRLYVESDLKILTGLIEPHMWAGFSGGRKAILPGIASLETMKYMHGFKMVAHPMCEPGLLDGNPFHQAGLEIMESAGADFVLNVTIDAHHRITGAWAGHPVAAHLRGCDFLRRHCEIQLPAPLDFAVTTNAGHPLDCNLYQTVKGVTAIAAVVRPGGAILTASACSEGVGSDDYRLLLESVAGPREFIRRLANPGHFVADQWCAQELYQVMFTHEVLIKSETLDPAWLAARGITPVSTVETAVEDLLTYYGPEARWAVFPDGPAHGALFVHTRRF